MENDRHKLFVGGITRETSEEHLKQHFSKYGDVLTAVVAKEKVSGQPRGFGFVRFGNEFDVVKALKDSHLILGRTVDVKKAIPRHEQMKYQQPQVLQLYDGVSQQNNVRTKKLFVGGLSSTTTEDEFKSYFERFGRTTDVVVMHDSVTNRPRGFGFVTFEAEDSVEIVMQSNFHELSDKRVEVKRAIPKEGIQINHNVPSFQATAYAPQRMIVQYPTVYNVPSFHYPYGYPMTAQGPSVPWSNPIMLPTGFYCPPPMETSCYLPYMSGFTGYNPAVWPVDGVGTIIPRLENLKLEVASNMGKPLQNGAYR